MAGKIGATPRKALGDRYKVFLIHGGQGGATDSFSKRVGCSELV